MFLFVFYWSLLKVIQFRIHKKIPLKKILAPRRHYDTVARDHEIHDGTRPTETSTLTSGRLLLHFYLTFFVNLLIFFGALLINPKGILFRFLIHQVIIAICFWEYIFSKNWGLRLSWFFKITCLLWAKEERTVFFFFPVFSFLLYPSSPSSIKRTERN